MEALWPLWDVIFSGAQPRGKWLFVNDDSYGAFSLRPYFAGHVALTTEIFAKLFADHRTRHVGRGGCRSRANVGSSQTVLVGSRAFIVPAVHPRAHELHTA
jgi:hypothetical protein